MFNFIKLEIDDCFCCIKSKIDLRAERLLRCSYLSDEQINKINERREAFLNEVDSCMNFNLENISPKRIKTGDQTDLKFYDYIQRFCFIIDFIQKKEELVNLKNFNQINLTDFIDEAFGYLIVCDEYISDEQILMIREFFKIDYGYRKQRLELFFDLVSKNFLEYLSEAKYVL
jgi:hypothetical protein